VKGPGGSFEKCESAQIWNLEFWKRVAR